MKTIFFLLLREHTKKGFIKVFSDLGKEKDWKEWDKKGRKSNKSGILNSPPDICVSSYVEKSAFRFAILQWILWISCLMGF